MTFQVVCGLACGWLLAILGTIPPLLDVAPYRLYRDIGICVPHFSSSNSLWYAITFSICTFIIPGSLIILCNLKVRKRENARNSIRFFVILFDAFVLFLKSLLVYRHFALVAINNCFVFIPFPFVGFSPLPSSSPLTHAE